MTGSTHVRVSLALVLAVSLAGCGATGIPFVGDDGGDDGRAEAIATDSVAEMQSVSAYNYTLANVVTFGGNELNMSADGTVNHTSERLFMDAVLSVRTNTTQSKEFSRVYVLDDTRCRAVGPTAAPEWNVTDGDVDAWNQGLSVRDQGRILNASGTDAALLENETIRGTDVYVVRIEPDTEALKTVVANGSDADLSNVLVRNATITQYVSQDRKRLLRTEMTVDYVVDGRRTTLELTMTYSDFGTDHPIEPPEAAKEAGCTA